MIAENLYHANLKISNEGHVTIESSWQLALSEKAESGGQLLNEARAWAGAVGDPLRIPLPDGSFEFSEQLFVTAIEFKAVGANSCQVVYSGIDRKVADFQLSIPIRDVDTDGFETCSVVWYVSCEQYDTFVASHPIGGEELWAGANFLLISIESKPFGKVGYELTLFARKVETRCISKVRSEKFVGVTRGGAIRRE
ncbi:MAG: hypothetical protein LBM70_07080, partial [Victivallales bacterium]|nr:hypothetical protein [Victivallales bacterium]